MAQENSSICNFIFGSIRTSLPMDMVDIDLTIQMVKGIYMYRKDHTAESMIFTPWSKKVIPFPYLDVKYKHLGITRDKRQHCHGKMATHFSSLSLPRCLETQEKETLAKLEPDRWARIGLTL